MSAALDSNFMIYAESFTDDARCGLAQKLLAAADLDQILVPAQSLAETIHWLLRKARKTRAEAAASAAYWRGMFRMQPTSEAVMQSAIELMMQHKLQIFDAIILASAAESGADLLLSEDMQDGFRWRGVTVANPFLPDPNPLIKSLTAP
jgi:predicted nucleic acid-binding protein